MDLNNNFIKICQHQPALKPVHPAQQFAGIYELAEVDKPNFVPGDLRRYEQWTNYEIVTTDLDKIWFSDQARVFSFANELELDRLEEIESDGVFTVVFVGMQKENLVIFKMEHFENNNMIREVIRTHTLAGNFLEIVEKDSWFEGLVCKKYARIK